jgi:hypothetical protein
MIRLFIKFTVRDYDAFRTVFDEHATERADVGVLGSTVHRTVKNPNEVTVCHDFATLEAAKTFERDARLRDAMVHAGVTHAPLMWLAELT